MHRFFLHLKPSHKVQNQIPKEVIENQPKKTLLIIEDFFFYTIRIKNHVVWV